MTDRSEAPRLVPITLPQAEVEDVLVAAEEIRASEFPTVPPDLLASVLAAEQDNLDNRAGAARAVGRAVDKWLADHPDQSDRVTTLTTDDNGDIVS